MPTDEQPQSARPVSPERERLQRESARYRIDDANAADFVRTPYRKGFPSRERVARWNREWLALEMKERGLDGSESANVG